MYIRLVTEWPVGDVVVMVIVMEEVVIVTVVVVAASAQLVRLVTRLGTARAQRRTVVTAVMAIVEPGMGVDSDEERTSVLDYLGRLCFWLGLCMDLSICIVWLR